MPADPDAPEFVPSYIPVAAEPVTKYIKTEDDKQPKLF